MGMMPIAILLPPDMIFAVDIQVPVKIEASDVKAKGLSLCVRVHGDASMFTYLRIHSS